LFPIKQLTSAPQQRAADKVVVLLYRENSVNTTQMVYNSLVIFNDGKIVKLLEVPKAS